MPTKEQPGRDALIYDPSDSAWAMANAVLAPPARLSRLVLYLIGGLLLAAIVFALFAEVSLTVSGRGIIRSSDRVRPLKSEVAGKIARIRVRNGEQVIAGQILIELEELLSDEQAKTAQGILEDAQAVIALANQKKTNDALTAAEVLLQRQQSLAGTGVAPMATQLWEQFKAYRQALEYRFVTLPGLLSAERFELGQLSQKLQKLRSFGLAGLASDEAELRTAMARVNATIESKQSNAMAEVGSARTSLEGVLDRFGDLLAVGQKSQRLESPVDGTVSNLRLAGSGELVAAGQELLQVIPAGSGLIAEVDIANKDIGGVREQLPVRLKLDAFPFQDYGVLPGHVDNVPHDVDAARIEEGPPTYKVVVALEQNSLHGPTGNDHPILLGMAMTADIQTQDMSIMRLFMVEVLKLGEVFE